ncbi:MAG: thioredoxin family protein [Planctomycetaceae bacterium]
MSVRRVRILPLAAAAALAAAGCSVRDEPAATVGDGRWWSSSTTHPARVGLVPGQPAAAAPLIEFIDGFDAGAKRAAETGLPMLVVFRATWCRWSGELAQAAAADPRVVRLARRFVCVAVDADRHADTCRTFGVRAFPTVIILDGARQERFRATGATAVARVATAMGDIAAAESPPRRIATAADDATRGAGFR